ncbi:MAG: AMP-binding protein [Sphingomonadaceae bacterium]|nr:AMP-binding protein [Sphingomonadaceae bacterium]
MTDPSRYENAYKNSIEDPGAFWLEAAEALDWTVKPTKGWNENDGWFADGKLNSCYNAIDRHVEAGHGERTALIHASAVTEQSQSFSYAEVLHHVERTAGMLAARGIGKGDRVIIYMPMIPETAFAMLACARIGAIHSVVFGGFAAPELAKRIDDAQPKLVLTASCGIEGSKVVAYKPLVDHALDLASHVVGHVILLQRPQRAADMIPDRDLDWQQEFAKADAAPCVPVASNDPLYILYTSGTTGVPKGVVRDNGGHATVLVWSMRNIYGVKPDETFWAASDVGWVVGHSYIVYGPLMAGCTSVLFEGKPVGTPDPGTFWRVIRDNDVSVFFTAPTAIRAIRKEDPEGAFIDEIATGSLRAMFLAGERADPDTIDWAEAQLGVPVFDHWWQTELGWPAIATCMGLDDTRRKPGSAGFPVPGFRFELLDDDGKPVPAGSAGNVTIKLPLAPGCYATLWNNAEGYAQAFAAFPGYYETGDAGHLDSDGFLNIMGRTDDIINVAGHRLSTGQMEEIVAGHPAVAECAVIGVDDTLKGMVPMALAVLKGGQTARSNIADEIVARVRDVLGPVAALKEVHIVEALPKTRSGKILRAAMRGIANGKNVPTPSTIENADVLEQVRSVLQ